MRTSWRRLAIVGEDHRAVADQHGGGERQEPRSTAESGAESVGARAEAERGLMRRRWQVLPLLFGLGAHDCPFEWSSYPISLPAREDAGSAQPIPRRAAAQSATNAARAIVRTRRVRCVSSMFGSLWAGCCRRV